MNGWMDVRMSEAQHKLPCLASCSLAVPVVASAACQHTLSLAQIAQQFMCCLPWTVLCAEYSASTPAKLLGGPSTLNRVPHAELHPCTAYLACLG